MSEAHIPYLRIAMTASVERKSSIRIVMLNIRSMRANFDELMLHIRENNVTFDVLGLTESWIKKEESFRFIIPGYRIHVQERGNKLGGGATLYVKDSLNCEIEDVVTNECNAIKFRISPPDVVPLSGILVYRFCKTSIGRFLDTIENVCGTLTDQAAIFGDMNINLLTTVGNVSYVNALASFGFKSHINSPTRVVGDASTCIDHFFFREASNRLGMVNVYHSMSDVPFSDHKLIQIELTGVLDPKTKISRR